ncbi:hypothetical protein QZQ24_16195 [Serratia marcescens]|uniref:hypothetical protein n=1 Tax=Serratia marcescens TaxID=615 RepID=UPI00276482E5|nr:hypothetical protein [Serratia marcescens]MDP8834535.1 hypothetical protein [Serratia marcescens]
MKLGRCPVCHSDLHLDAILEDDAGRELLTLLVKLPGAAAKAMVAYIGLFRPDKSNLSHSRAVKLVNEVLAQHPPGRVLTHALSETVERIRAKRISGDKKPLSGHRYLREVYRSSEQIFAQTSNIAARERDESHRVTDQDRNRDDYLAQMKRMGQDVSKLPGGAEWLMRNGGENHGG